MHIIIVGSGKIGATLAGWSVSNGHEVAVIETDRSRCVALDDALGSVSVTGDGTDAGTLAKAGANRADVLIATTGMDDVNLAACQLAKHRFRVLRTISLVNSPDHTELFGLLGIDVTIDVTELVASRIQDQITSRGVSQLLPVAGAEGRTLVSIRVPPDSGANGRALKDMPLPDGTLVSLVINPDGSAHIPGEDTMIHAGDQVVAVTTLEQVEELRSLLVQQQEA